MSNSLVSPDGKGPPTVEATSAVSTITPSQDPEPLIPPVGIDGSGQTQAAPTDEEGGLESSGNPSSTEESSGGHESPIVYAGGIPVNHVFDLVEGGFPETRLTWNVIDETRRPAFVILKLMVNDNGKPVITSTSDPVASDDRTGRYPTDVDRSTKVDSNFYGSDMFFVLEWNDTDTLLSGSMRFVSPVFTATDSADDVDSLSNKLTTRAELDDELRNGFAPQEGGSLLPSASEPEPSDSVNISVPIDSSTPTPSDAADGSEPSSIGDGNGGGNRLGSPAKIGIGIGCAVLGIIIIALAVFLLMRRRRRRGRDHISTSTTFNSAPRGIGEYVSDKETHAARVADSPYSEDGRGSALLANAEQQDRSFAPYPDAPYVDAPPHSDVSPHALTTDVRVESRQGARSATPTQSERQLPNSVAHLVEEGMTEEQIRRLEEEERALDRAIAQAGRGSGR